MYTRALAQREALGEAAIQQAGTKLLWRWPDDPDPEFAAAAAAAHAADVADATAGAVTWVVAGAAGGGERQSDRTTSGVVKAAPGDFPTLAGDRKSVV